MARKANPAEKLDDATMAKVVAALEAEKPITKKAACEMLNISYNVTRLGTLIEKYKERLAYIKRRKAENRGKPADAGELSFIISGYLEGATVDSLSQSTFRSPVFIKNLLEDNDVPIRGVGNTYFTPELIPEGAMRQTFKDQEVVYSARYDSIARIEKEYDSPKYGKYYRVWLLSEKWLQYAYQEAYELASLEHLRKLGVKI
jgi:hypothetical protein